MLVKFIMTQGAAVLALLASISAAPRITLNIAPMRVVRSNNQLLLGLLSTTRACAGSTTST